MPVVAILLSRIVLPKLEKFTILLKAPLNRVTPDPEFTVRSWGPETVELKVISLLVAAKDILPVRVIASE